jgi:hypothetical protein
VGYGQFAGRHSIEIIGEDNMKKLLIIALAIGVISTGLWAQNPKDIVKKCIAKIGGEEAIKRYFDMSGEGQLSVTYGTMKLSGKIKLTQKGRKSRVRVEINLRGTPFVVLRAYDGKVAWLEQMGNISDQPALNSESDLDHTLNLLLEKDAKLTLAKSTEIEGKKVTGVEVEFKGKKTLFYFDNETFLPMEIVFKDQYFGAQNTKEMIERRSRLANYKKINNILFPMKRVDFQKGKKLMEIDFEKVVFNPAVSADIFKRPDQPLDLRYMEEMIN